MVGASSERSTGGQGSDVTMETVYLSQKEFDELLDYSCSVPTGQTIGKRWRCRNDYYDASRGWLMGEYIPDPNDEPGWVAIKWRKIVIGTPPPVRTRRAQLPVHLL